LAKGRRTYIVATYFERVEGTPFLFVSSFYLPTYLQSYVAHTYVLNSDEGLTERALVSLYDELNTKDKIKKYLLKAINRKNNIVE
jgi:hypothetical protein